MRERLSLSLSLSLFLSSSIRSTNRSSMADLTYVRDKRRGKDLFSLYNCKRKGLKREKLTTVVVVPPNRRSHIFKRTYLQRALLSDLIRSYSIVRIEQANPHVSHTFLQGVSFAFVFFFFSFPSNKRVELR